MICAARESGAKRIDKGTAGESRSRKATGLNGALFSARQPVANDTMYLLRRAVRAVKGVFYLEVETALHSEMHTNPNTHDLCGSLRSKLYRQRHYR